MGELIKLYENNIDFRKITKVVEVLKSGGIVVYPTDTVYAIGCDITNSKALQRLAIIKKIKLNKAKLSFMCYSFNNLNNYTQPLSNTNFKIIKKCLPGPYTFILKGNNNLPKDFKNKKTVGIRIPDNKIASELIQQLGNPIVCTSVHDIDEIVDYTTDPELIYERFGKTVDIVIDAGIGGVNPSTVVDLCEKEPKVLRYGKGDFFN